jgi:hypothetical protein
MLRLQIRAAVLLLGALLLARPELIAAPTGPLAAMYADDQARGKAVAQGFAAVSLPASGTASSAAQIYLTTGDLQRAFDNARFRPGAAIVPTNTELQLTAKAPATQQVLVDRVRKQPDAMRALQEQVDARRARSVGAGGNGGLLELGVDGFVAKLSGSGNRATAAFPATVCLLATDFPQGGAIDRRELFAQDRFRKGIATCLGALDGAGVESIVVPLVGAASSGIQKSDPQYEGQRVLMECRLINAVAGIALGIHDFSPGRRNLREIGIVQWDQDMLDMFGATRGAPLSNTARSAFQAYMGQVKLALRNGLAGQKTTASDISGSCSTIFNPQS